MDIEMDRTNSLPTDDLDFTDGDDRPKSSLRMVYEAETKVFKAQHGNLEEIRQKLGFSRRKMCRLLLVDPSAWTRWCKDEAKVPPHIYRSLEWFLALNQKAITHPELAAVFNYRHRATGDAVVATEVQALKVELRIQKQISWALIGGVSALSLTVLFLLFR